MSSDRKLVASRDAHGRTALQKAAEAGRWEVVELLLNGDLASAGELVNATDKVLVFISAIVLPRIDNGPGFSCPLLPRKSFLWVSAKRLLRMIRIRTPFPSCCCDVFAVLSDPGRQNMTINQTAFGRESGVFHDASFPPF